MRLNPYYPPWYVFELGTAYRLTGQYAEAIVTLQEAIRRNPNVGSYYLRLAVSYRLQWLSQQNPTAQTLEPAVAAQRALTLNDSDHWVHINLASLSLSTNSSTSKPEQRWSGPWPSRLP
jgi:tetratricopeptide (TPR) repeat protein